MVAHAGDTNELERFNGSEAIPPVPYASRGAGLYSEVSWDPIAAFRGRRTRAAVTDRRPTRSTPGA